MNLKEKLQNYIGCLLFIGLLISLFITMAGGVWYLLSSSHAIQPSHLFQKGPVYATSAKIWRDIFTFSPQGLIQLGILCLVLTQLLRVLLLVWFFSALRDRIFSFLSLFILIILAYSLFWAL